MVTWSEYKKCKNCGAPEGQPCRSMTGNFDTGFVYGINATKPHKGRKKK